MAKHIANTVSRLLEMLNDHNVEARAAGEEIIVESSFMADGAYGSENVCIPADMESVRSFLGY